MPIRPPGRHPRRRRGPSFGVKTGGTTYSIPGTASAAEQERDLLAQAAAADQHQPFRSLGELIGELHGDPAAQGVPDDRGPLVAGGDQEVAERGRQSSQRVVGVVLRRVAVAEQVRGEHRRALGQARGSPAARSRSSRPSRGPGGAPGPSRPRGRPGRARGGERSWSRQHHCTDLLEDVQQVVGVLFLGGEDLSIIRRVVGSSSPSHRMISW